MKSALKRIGWQSKTSLSDAEMAGVAIAYNTGRYDPAEGLKQGYFDGKKYYGENYFAYLQLAKSVSFPAAEAAPSKDARALPDGGEEVAKEEGGEDDIDARRRRHERHRRRRRRQRSHWRRKGGESEEDSSGEESFGEEEGRAFCRQPSRREAKSEAQGRDRRCGREASQGPRGRREAALTARLRPAPARFARSRRRTLARNFSRKPSPVRLLQPAGLVEQVAGAADVGLGLLQRSACRETPATGAGDGSRRSRRWRRATR